MMSHCVGRMAALSESESEKFEEWKANDKTFQEKSPFSLHCGIIVSQFNSYQTQSQSKNFAMEN